MTGYSELITSNLARGRAPQRSSPLPARHSPGTSPAHVQITPTVRSQPPQFIAAVQIAARVGPGTGPPGPGPAHCRPCPALLLFLSAPSCHPTEQRAPALQFCVLHFCYTACIPFPSRLLPSMLSCASFEPFLITFGTVYGSVFDRLFFLGRVISSCYWVLS